MSKKGNTIYCLVPRTIPQPITIENVYKYCIAWHTDYVAVYQYAKESVNSVGWDIMIGNNKSYRKYDPTGYEDYELYFVDRQWVPHIFADEAWESVMTDYQPYDEAIGVMNMIIDDECSDSHEVKILKKAIEIIKVYKELLAKPIQINELEESHRLNEEWRDKVHE